MEILTARQIRYAEEKAFKEFYLSESVLMERAGFAVFKKCKALLAAGSKVLLLVGRGNNGGDGFVAARLLNNAGYDVLVCFVSVPSDISPQTQAVMTAAAAQGVEIAEVSSVADLPPMERFDLIVDALFGSGLSRPLSGVYAELVSAANKARGIKLAVDVPTGVYASSSLVPELCFVADYTLTFSRPKIVHCLHPAKSCCGEVFVEDIGVPGSLLNSNIHLLDEYNTPQMPFRKLDGHKGHYGHVLVVGGALGKSGASVLASLSAMRSGAGLTTCALPGALFSMLSPFPEIMGLFCRDSKEYSLEDAKTVLDFYNESMTLLIGCGLGRHEGASEFVKEILYKTDSKCVIDADAIYALDDEVLACLKNRAVLTPHIGEFAHLLGMDKRRAEDERLELSRNFALKYKLTLMVKSAETVITTGEGEQYISSYGTPALSKGGSGDILAGITAALLAQKYNTADACKLACKIQGKAARLAEGKRGAYSVTARDIIDFIGYEE